MLRHAIAALLALMAAAGAAADEAGDEFHSAPGGFSRVADGTCTISGRDLEIRVWERVDSGERTAAWMLEACVTETDLPITCLATMTAAEALPEGMESSGRSFAIRCVPVSRVAWIMDLKWTAAGLDMQAWKLDLAPLVTAPIVTLDDGARVIESPAGAQLVPEEPHAWTAADPRPLPECVPLSLSMEPAGEDLAVTIRAASASCTSWRVLYDGKKGSFTASPLPGSAPPDLLRGAAAPAPLILEPGKPISPPRSSKRPPLSSFSRR